MSENCGKLNKKSQIKITKYLNLIFNEKFCAIFENFGAKHATKNGNYKSHAKAHKQYFTKVRELSLKEKEKALTAKIFLLKNLVRAFDIHLTVKMK